jgi:hypothetical protein
MHTARKSLKISCGRQVFQCKPPRNTVRVKDISELFIASSKMSLKDKRDLFYANGVDYDRVDKYYEHVKKLNSCWDKQSYNEHKFVACFWNVLKSIYIIDI